MCTVGSRRVSKRLCGLLTRNLNRLPKAYLCTLGYAAPETEINMTRARELCRAVGNTASLLPIVVGLWTYYLCKGDMNAPRETAEQWRSCAGMSMMPPCALARTRHSALPRINKVIWSLHAIISNRSISSTSLRNMPGTSGYTALTRAFILKAK